MAKNKMSDLRDHLFETLEKLRSNNDPEADPSEKIDIETASTISAVAGRLVDTYKVEVQAMALLSKADNPNSMTRGMQLSGILSNEVKQLGE